MVEARGVRKSYGGVEVLKGVDLTVSRGEVTCLIGPSGSGKSTLLRCINHLEKHDAGELSRKPGRLRRAPSVACTSAITARSVPSDPTSAWCSSTSTCSHILARWTTWRSGRPRDGEKADDARAKAAEQLARVDLLGSAKRPGNCPVASSSASRSLARSPCEPELMLFDEPTSALDPEFMATC